MISYELDYYLLSSESQYRHKYYTFITFHISVIKLQTPSLKRLRWFTEQCVTALAKEGERDQGGRGGDKTWLFSFYSTYKHEEILAWWINTLACLFVSEAFWEVRFVAMLLWQSYHDWCCFCSSKLRAGKGFGYSLILPELPASQKRLQKRTQVKSSSFLLENPPP